jgi:hypothetical protein
MAPSLLGMMVGVLFVILGLTVGFPAGIFAIIWIVFAATSTPMRSTCFVEGVLQSTI